MPHSQRHGICCPQCDAPSRVIGTRRGASAIERVRQCKLNDHLFETDEVLYRCPEPDCDWTTESDVQNTRNQGDRTIRERVCRGGTPFKTIERVRRAA